MLPAIFFATPAGNEPVREWLRILSREDKLTIGTDLRTVQFGFPIGMPLCRQLQDGIYEVRTSLPSKREARILFCHEVGGLVILHGFIKKTRTTPRSDIELALRRRNEYRAQSKSGRRT